jgi:hypothetical protein
MKTLLLSLAGATALFTVTACSSDQQPASSTTTTTEETVQPAPAPVTTQTTVTQ